MTDLIPLEIRFLLINVIFGIVDSLILATIVIVSFIRYNKTRYRQFLYLTLEFLGIFLWAGFTATSNVLFYFEVFLSGYDAPTFLTTLLGYLGHFSAVYSIIFLILFVDSISRTTIDPVKMLVFGVIATLATYTALEPGQAAKDVTILTYYASALVILYRSFLWAYYAAKVYLNSPENLKRKSLMVLVGTFLFGIIPSFFIITMIVLPDVGINELLFVIGILLIAFPLISESKLLYVLPFRTSRLAVFNDAGLPLFYYDWITKGEDKAGDVLFSGVMLGISGILKESLQKGNIRVISLDQSVLHVQKHEKYSVTFVLETTKASRSLPIALKSFAESFIEQFDELLNQKIFTKEMYSSASSIVSQCFPFLPEFE
ncbi:MAG: hypothetical protein ACXAEU_25645 [Candidatus Hodarchaeales archaeon]|jgi:hypothetical protein